MIIPFSQKYNYKAGKQKKVTQIYDNTKKRLHEAMKRKKKKIELCIITRSKITRTVSKNRNTRELVNPPSMVNNSDDANFPLYIS